MQVEDDLKQGVVGAVPIPSDDAGKEDVIAALVANVEAMIRADRKITALKQLQVSKAGLKKYDCYGAHLLVVADF
jgi:methionine salvage enolase-phosphatase E1